MLLQVKVYTQSYVLFTLSPRITFFFNICNETCASTYSYLFNLLLFSRHYTLWNKQQINFFLILPLHGGKVLHLHWQSQRIYFPEEQNGWFFSHKDSSAQELPACGSFLPYKRYLLQDSQESLYGVCGNLLYQVLHECNLIFLYLPQGLSDTEENPVSDLSCR